MTPTERRTACIRMLAGAVLVASSIVACFFLYDLLKPKPYTRTVKFLIVPDEPGFLDKADLNYERRNEIFRQTQISQIKSKDVVRSALREPGIAALAILAPCDDKVQWVMENLDAKLLAADVDDDKDGLIDEDSRILQVQMHGTHDQADDLRNLMDAISDAYMRNVVYKDQERVAEARYAEGQLMVELHKKLVLIIEERNAIREASPEAVAELEVIEIEIDEMTAVFRHLIHKRELKELAGGIGHVRQINPAADMQDVPSTTNFLRLR